MDSIQKIKNKSTWLEPSRMLIAWNQHIKKLNWKSIPHIWSKTNKTQALIFFKYPVCLWKHTLFEIFQNIKIIWNRNQDTIWFISFDKMLPFPIFRFFCQTHGLFFFLFFFNFNTFNTIQTKYNPHIDSFFSKWHI